MKIDPKQIQLIHVARAQCGLSDDEYRAVIAGRTRGKKTSSRDLTYDEADAVINYFVKELGFKIRSNYIRTSGEYRRKKWAYANSCRSGNKPLPNNVVALPSREQLDMIGALVRKIDWRVGDGYERWRKKYMQISRIVTARQAAAVIEGLKGLLEHQKPHMEGA